MMFSCCLKRRTAACTSCTCTGLRRLLVCWWCCSHCCCVSCRTSFGTDDVIPVDMLNSYAETPRLGCYSSCEVWVWSSGSLLPDAVVPMPNVSYYVAVFVGNISRSGDGSRAPATAFEDISSTLWMRKGARCSRGIHTHLKWVQGSGGPMF